MTYRIGVTEEEYTLGGEAPFYTEIYNILQETYPDIGLRQTFITYSDDSLADNIRAYKDEILALFDSRFYYREVGGETVERFQKLVDMVYMNTRRRYDMLFKNFVEYLNANDYGPGKVEVYKGTGNEKVTATDKRTNTEETSSNLTDNTTATNKNKNTFNDTPVTALLDTADYATNITENEGTGSTTNTTAGNGSKTTDEQKDTSSTKDDTHDYRKQTFDNYFKDWNDYLSQWRSIVNEYVAEYDICFINELGRV